MTTIINRNAALEIFEQVSNPFSGVTKKELFDLDFNFLMSEINACILDEALNKSDNEWEFETTYIDYPHDGNKFTHLEKDVRGTVAAEIINKGYNLSFNYQIDEDGTEICVFHIH